MVAFFLDWWWLFGLVVLPQVFNAIAGLVARVVASRLDHYIPDDLPMTAGQWLEQQLAAGGIRVAAVRSEGLMEGAYIEPSRLILLNKASYFKKDPVFWAVAAHELGHAQMEQRHPVLSTLIWFGKWLRWLFATAGLAIVLGNVLYAIPAAFEIAFYCLTAAIGLEACVLVDESAASRGAMRLLRDSNMLTKRHLRAARVVLVFAFGTYLSTFVAHVVLLSQWHWVYDVIGSGRFDGIAEPLAWWWVAVVGAITAASLVHAFFVYLAIYKPSPVHVDHDGRRVDLSFFHTVVHLLWNAVILALIWLLWDRSESSAYQWCVIVAFVPVVYMALASIRIVFSPMMMALSYANSTLLAKYGHVHASDEYVDAIDEQAVERGAKVAQAAKQELDNNPTFGQRLLQLSRLAYLPLVVAFWLTLS